MSNNNFDDYLPKKQPEPYVQRTDKPSEQASAKQPEAKGSVGFTADEEQAIVDKYLGKHRNLRRKERKLIINREKEGGGQLQWIVMAMAMAGLFFLFYMYQTAHDEILFVPVLLLGSMMFLPIGMIFGWLFLDPYMRCKILRKSTHRNYGLIYFVGKGNKIATKVKNFDDALVWKKNEVWVITKEHVYQITKDGNAINEGNKIDPESIITLIDTVPILFVDLDSMQPLSLARDRREGINPLELGASLKAWADNQLAKALVLRKSLDMYFIIVVIASIAAAGISYMAFNTSMDLVERVKLMQQQLTSIIAQLPKTPIP